jgi:hypothetical protein
MTAKRLTLIRTKIPGESAMKKLVIWILTLVIALLAGWATKSLYFSHSVETPVPAASTPPPPAPDEPNTGIQEPKSGPPASQNEETEERQLSPLHISPERIQPPEDNPVDLASQTMSIKKEQKKRLEIIPGVKVKSGGVDISLDKENTKTLELRPNDQNQIMYKQKF